MTKPPKPAAKPASVSKSNPRTRQRKPEKRAGEVVLSAKDRRRIYKLIERVEGLTYHANEAMVELDSVFYRSVGFDPRK